MFLGLFTSVWICRRLSIHRRDTWGKVHTVNGSLEASEDTVNLLAGLISDMANGRVVNTDIREDVGIDLLAATRAEVNVAAFNILDDLTRVVLGLFRGVGVLDVGLGYRKSVRKYQA
jgi:hypothetical protein